LGVPSLFSGANRPAAQAVPARPACGRATLLTMIQPRPPTSRSNRPLGDVEEPRGSSRRQENYARVEPVTGAGGILSTTLGTPEALREPPALPHQWSTTDPVSGLRASSGPSQGR